MAILVTGGAGYIGSHMTYVLADNGEKVVVLDNLSTGVRENVCPAATFVAGSAGDAALVRKVIAENDIEAVVHFAGSVVVPESMDHPLRYYENNTCASRTLIETCIQAGIDKFIFSSTAAVYGAGNNAPLAESFPTSPINPYGRSKLMVEWMLEDAARAHKFRFVALRYFNVAGADPKGRTGQSTPRATHLVKRALQVVTGREPYLDIFGTDYPTPDGTGVRDYIHVCDLTDVHSLALEHLRENGDSGIYNCGYGGGVSVRQIVSGVERVSGKPLPTRDQPRRQGDPAFLVASPDRMRRRFGWSPKYQDIDLIIESALRWERKLAG